MIYGRTGVDLAADGPVPMIWSVNPPPNGSPKASMLGSQSLVPMARMKPSYQTRSMSIGLESMNANAAANGGSGEKRMGTVDATPSSASRLLDLLRPHLQHQRNRLPSSEPRSLE